MSIRAPRIKEMLLALMLVIVSTIGTGAFASDESPEAKADTDQAVSIAHSDKIALMGDKEIRPGHYFWKERSGTDGLLRLVIGLSDQLAYLYRGDTLIAVASISTGTEGRITPTGKFSVLQKEKFYRSIKYDNAPMPHMQRIDQYGIALHGGHNPGYPASHGCIRLPPDFAAKLYAITQINTPVWIGS